MSSKNMEIIVSLLFNHVDFRICRLAGACLTLYEVVLLVSIIKSAINANFVLRGKAFAIPSDGCLTQHKGIGHQV